MKIKLVGVFVVVGILVILAISHEMFRPLTYDQVAEKTATALGSGDVDTLLALTLPEEREKLHLTPESVRGFLTDTLYSQGFPGAMDVKLTQTYPVDQFMYSMSPKDPNRTPNIHWPLPVAITLRPDGHWYLALGYMLLNATSCAGKPQDISDIGTNFKVFADRHKILGTRLNTYGYAFLH